jgi:tRNA-specific 2-thiouridylase
MINMQDRFSDDIIENFISEYLRGRTPNPCIRCNDLIKFQVLLSYALANGFDYLATGHYARIEQDPSSLRYLLKKGLDAGKDQSYFLYRLTHDRMKHVLFPLGGYQKKEVRRLASAMKLPAAKRPESQETCFIPDNNYRAFLKESAPETLRPGEIVMTDGKVVGKHDGIAFFTVGQRRKLGVAAGERLYVVRVEPDMNRVVLGKLADLQTVDTAVSQPNFIPFDTLATHLKVTVKIRYRSPFIPAMIEPAGSDRVRILFDHPVPGVCPGQAAVFYDGDVVVGGGIIEAA